MNKKIVIIVLIIILIITLFAITNKKGKKETNSNNNNSETTQNVSSTENTKQEIALENYVYDLEDGTLKNGSERLRKSKNFEWIEITEVRVIRNQDNVTKLMIDTHNPSNKKWETKKVTLIMKDKAGEEMGKIATYLYEIEANDSVSIEIETDEKFINVYDYEVIDGHEV